MKPNDFFREEQDPNWNVNGDPWSVRSVFDDDLVVRLRRGPVDGTSDLEAAFGLAHLAQRELTAYGTDHSEVLDNDQVAAVLRSLTVVLKRLGVGFDPPFRDFTGFHGYWSGQGMSGGGGWAARRGYVNELFAPVFSRLDTLEDAEIAPAYRGVDGALKNIIFASTGPKPRIVLRDALNNVIEVVQGGEHCLFYDRSLADSGLSWNELVQWWRATAGGMAGKTDMEVARRLYGRLAASLGSEPERLLFRTYCERYGRTLTAQRSCHRSTCTTIRRLLGNGTAGQDRSNGSAWTSCCSSRTVSESCWRWTASNTTPRETWPHRSGTPRWSPRIAHYG
jgi:hypothetical protein